MAENNTKGAVHLTSLSLDLTQFNENIRQIEQATAEVADVSVENLSKIKDALNFPNEQFSFSIDMEKFADGINSAKESMQDLSKFLQESAKSASELGESLGSASKGQDEFFKKSTSAESLARAYETIQVKIAGIISSLTASKVKDTGMEDLIARAKEVEIEIANAANEIRETGNITEESRQAFSNFKSVINEISIAFSHFKTGSNEYKKSLEPIEQQAKQTVASLKVLEKSAVFSTSKAKVAELRAEYEQFINKLKNTRIGTDEAQSELAKLQKRFEELDSTVKRGNTTIENWVNKITESAKWQLANSALNLIRQSFGDVTGTIIETENAVIELQRVLGDKSLSNTAIADELYNIAYEYGQTFENVQETAVKFAQTGRNWQETIEATRATMLALNTAELDVSAATEGLIAVMAQFDLQGKDLQGVIDKINKTADNFPITSEKIVAALQRAGGTAKAFGLSLEKTIGIITALGAATGRAGEAIGTAMNSLISFSMKDTSLAKFSEFLGKDVSSYGVLELWKELADAIKNAGDEGEAFAEKMATSADFNGLLNEELASAIGLTEEYTKATEETNKMLAEGKDIYSTVGTYRQNYFIALLNNIDTAIEAIEGMNTALGYSERENLTAMEAFSKQWNQLVVSAKELAIQFGNAGFLDFTKLLVNSADYALRLTKNIGGLNTVLATTSALLLAIKWDQFKAKITSLANTFTNFTKLVNAYNTAISLGYTKTEAFKIALSGFQLTVAGVIGVLALVVTTIGGITAAIDKANEKARQARQESIESGREASSNIKKVALAYKKYNEAMDSGNIEEVNKKRSELISLLGKEEKDIDILVDRYKDVKDGYEDVSSALKTLTEQEYEYAKAKALQAKIDSEQAFKDIASASNMLDTERPSLFGGGQSIELLMFGEPMDQFFQKFRENLDDTSLSADQMRKMLVNALEGTATSSEDARKKLDVLNAALKAANKSFDSAIPKNLETLLKLITDKTELFTDAVKANDEALANYEATSGTFEEYLASLTEEFEEAGESAEGFTISAENLTSVLEEIDKAIGELGKSVDSFQSAYKTLIDVVDQYNETGEMTADMLQSLLELEPEYIQLLDLKNGTISINQERLQDLIATNDNYLDQLVALKAAEAIDTMLKDAQAAAAAGLTIEEYKLQAATIGLTSSTYDLVTEFYNGKISADEFKNKLAETAQQAGITADYMATLTESLYNVANGYRAFYTAQQNETADKLDKIINSNKYSQPTNSIRRYYTPSTSSSKSSSSSSKKEEDPFKEEKDALKELLAVYEHSIKFIEKAQEKTRDVTKQCEYANQIVDIYKKMQAEVHAQAERYRAAGLSETSAEIREMQNMWWDYQEEIEKVMEEVYDTIVGTYENAISYLEHLYDSAEERLDYSYMGENLKKQLDYQVKIQREAERELERLAQKGIDVNDDAAKAVIDRWYEAEKAIREISQKIAADILEPYDDFIDLADKFEIWEYMDFTKVDYLRDKLAALNKLLQKGTITLKQYNQELRSISYAIFDAQKELYEKEKYDLEKKLKDETNIRKEEIDALKDQKDKLNKYYDDLIKGYNKEIDAWEKKKDKVSEYYDTLIENLRDVEKANERINKQIDYYNERQKIITNLEQAQSRSGVEWREKEMEYQQQLIDLDEDWKRTLAEWDVEDKIAALEKLKEQTLKDIELSIQAIRDMIEAAQEAKEAAIDSIDAQIKAIEDLIEAAEEAAEEEVQVIEDKIKDLSKMIAEAIKNGTENGLVDSREELDKTLVDGTNAMLEFIDTNEKNVEDSAKVTATNVFGIYKTDFIAPMTNSIDEIAGHMKNALVSGVAEGASDALTAIQKNLIQPLKAEMANIMSQANSAKQSISYSVETTTKKLTPYQQTSFNAGKGPVAATPPSLKDTLKENQWDKVKNPTQVFITNYNNNLETAAKRSAQTIQNILNR